MQQFIGEFTLFFESPFWVGIYTRQEGKKFSVYKIVFGAEPKDIEIYEFFLKNFNELNFSSDINVEQKCYKKINPKRKQREIKKLLSNSKTVCTKAQQVIKLQREQGKIEKRKNFRLNCEEEEKRKFNLKQQKKKKKIRGH